MPGYGETLTLTPTAIPQLNMTRTLTSRSRWWQSVHPSSAASSSSALGGSACSTGMWHDGSAGSLTTVKRVRQTGQQLFVSAHVVMHARQKEVWPQPSSAAFRLGHEKQITHVSSSSVPRRRRRSGRVLAWSSSTPISDDAAAESAAAAASIQAGKVRPDGQDEKQPTVLKAQNM